MMREEIDIASTEKEFGYFAEVFRYTKLVLREVQSQHPV